MIRTSTAIFCWVVSLAVGVAMVQAQEAAPVAKLSQADLEEMFGPIALYPDSLLANVLAASVYPDEVGKAAKFMQAGGKAEDLAKQPWEPPVQAVAKVPEVLSLLAENMDWTTAIGQAYLAQSADVTAAIQALRAKARENGVLQSNEQQTVIQEGSTVIIEPAEPEIVYVPQYDPQVVYVEHYDPGWSNLAAGAISFGAGIAIGAAFDAFDCDWHGGCVSWGHWGGHGDVDIDRNTDINTGDINVGNRPRPGNEGQQWRPNRDKMPTQNGRPRTDKLDQYRGDRGRQAMGEMRKPAARPAAQPAARPGGATPAARPGGAAPAARPGGATPAQQPLKKVSPPRAGTGAAGASARAPSRAPAARPSTPAQRPAASPRKPSSTPSAFNRGGASQASRNRGSASRGGGGGSRGGGGGRGGGGRGGGGRGGGGRR